jgi:2-aminoethylphosphonate-pyruvate transaminase
MGLLEDIRSRLLDIGGVQKGDYESIILQGSGTYGLEAVVSSTIPPDGKLLVIINGAYGRRIAEIARVHNIDLVTLEFPENKKPDLDEIETTLQNDKDITQVAVIHCETTTGMINPIKEIGSLVERYGKIYFVDAMSSFGAVPFNLAECNIDYLVSSANKCIEGVPGFSIVLAKRESLEATEGYSRTLSFNLLAQWRGFESNGQFRFTPPTHTLIAFHQALVELELEGGVDGRAARYRSNYETLLMGMRELGFSEYLDPEDQGYIITSFRYPDQKNFVFNEFYSHLNARDYVIYPGKLSQEDCFRVGSIGRIFPSDVKALLAAVKDTLEIMQIDLQTTKMEAIS